MVLPPQRGKPVEEVHYRGAPGAVRKESTVELRYTHCAGIDVHQNSLSVCALTPGSGATDEPAIELRSFGTFTNELLLLCGWLKQIGITHVAMESTGVYSA